MASDNISVAQLTVLMDYLESHQELALGYFNRSKEGRSLSKRLWDKCAQALNSVSANCATKTGEEWRTYFNDYKSKLLRKIRKDQSEKSATGGGPAKPFHMTPIQQRLHSILGKDVGKPLPGVRHNPLCTTNENTADSGSPGPSHNNNDIRMDFHDGEHDNNMFFNEEVLEQAGHSENNIEILDFEGIFEHSQSASEPREQQQHREHQHSPSLYEPHPGSEQSPREQQQQREQPRTARNSRRRRQEQREHQPRNPRRRQQRSPQPRSPRRNAEENEGEPTMREAANRLEQLERLNADALLVHARAINRLAAAMEAIAERLPQCASFPPTMRRQPTRNSNSDEVPRSASEMPAANSDEIPRSASPMSKKRGRFRFWSDSD